MKIANIASIAALALLGFSRVSATAPTMTWDSYGFFGTSGYYPIEYWVDVSDPDGDLQSLSVSAHFESSDNWLKGPVRGNGFHLQVHGYGDTIDGYTTGKVEYTDASDGYHYEEVEFSF